MTRQALLSALVSSLATVATFIAMHYFAAPRLPVNAVEVPPVVTLSPEQARALLEPRGLLLVIDGEREDDRVSAGMVSEQRPLGGSRLRRGDEVHASLARAVTMKHVPNLAGLTGDAARAALAQAGLRAGNVADALSDTVARGLVTSSTPPSGAEVRPDALVDFSISAGPLTAAVPSVIGKRLSAAKDLLEKAGFAVGGTKYGSNDDYEQGIVIKQNPAGGVQATPGVKIDLVIND
jgi:serine/threonine-protein kinase